MTENKTYKDWQGNPIVAGQALVLVRTEPMFSEMKMMLFDPKNKKAEQIGKTIIPLKHIWEVMNEFKVWEKNRALFYTLQDEDNTFHFQLSSMLWMNKDLVCIKGVSDDEKDYYTRNIV